MKIYEYDNIDDFLSKYIDIFSTLYVDEHNHLVTREKEFFIEHIKMVANKIPLLGQVANNQFDKKHFQTRTYRKKLKSKGWIIQTPDGIKIPPAFDFSKGVKNKLQFNFAIAYTNGNNTANK